MKGKSGLLQLLVVVIVVIAPVSGSYDGYESYATINNSSFNQLILNIYVKETGKALVMGYVEHEDIDSLPFLKTSEYLYENDTKQLYALTNALTWKYRDDWGINFTTGGYYTEYHTIFYLPGDVKLGKIKCSEGLEHFVSASSESFVIDTQGYDIDNPMTTIEYQQLLKETDGAGVQPFNETGAAGVQPFNETGAAGVVFDFGFGYLLLVIALLVLALLLTLVIARIIVKIKRGEDTRHVEVTEVKRGEIELTSEMMRVMETLTDRERAIVNALIKHNGEMTQVDLRYETGIPKSSLTGILRTLEKRKIINKKEWGRTNVIELSEWFLRKKGD